MLHLRMFLGAEDPHGEVTIVGTPPFHLRVEGDDEGEAATVGALVNAIPRITLARPGLRTMMELPIAPAPSGFPAA